MPTSETLTTAVRQLLKEAFGGAEGGNSWFVDDAGLLATAHALSAEQASRAPTAGGATIAAHIEHVRWFVALLNAYARGERPPIDWGSSWSVREVDADGWPELLAALEREARELQDHLDAGIDLDDAQRVMTILATVAHVAYHVGAVRQMAKAVTAGSGPAEA